MATTTDRTAAAVAVAKDRLWRVLRQEEEAMGAEVLDDILTNQTALELELPLSPGTSGGAFGGRGRRLGHPRCRHVAGIGSR